MSNTPDQDPYSNQHPNQNYGNIPPQPHTLAHHKDIKNILVRQLIIIHHHMQGHHRDIKDPMDMVQILNMILIDKVDRVAMARTILPLHRLAHRFHSARPFANSQVSMYAS